MIKRDVLEIIPARSGSNRIKNKNVKFFMEKQQSLENHTYYYLKNKQLKPFIKMPLKIDLKNKKMSINLFKF